MQNMRNIFIVVTCVILASLSSCNGFFEAHTADVEELSWNPDSVAVVGVGGGTVTIPVYANGKVYLSPVEDVEWAEISTDVLEADGTVKVTCEPNTGMRRRLQLTMTLADTDLCDTIEIRQEGIKAYLEVWGAKE